MGKGYWLSLSIMVICVTFKNAYKTLNTMLLSIALSHYWLIISVIPSYTGHGGNNDIFTTSKYILSQLIPAFLFLVVNNNR